MNKKAKKALGIGNEVGDSVVTSIFAGLPFPLFVVMSVIYYLIVGGIVLIVKKIIKVAKSRK